MSAGRRIDLDGCVSLALASWLLLAVAACSLPQWRIWQKKIDPKATETPAAVVEARREAAAFLAARSDPARFSAPLPPPLSEIHAVAVDLSASLGAPKKPVAAADYERTIAALRAAALADQKQRDAWRAFALKYAGKPLEDTGLNLFGPLLWLGIPGVIALCVFVPGVGYVLLRVVPVLFSAARRAAGAVETIAQKAPAAVEEAKAALSPVMSAAEKNVIAFAKSRLPTA